MGVAGLIQALERLPVVASTLQVVAHPDDENSALLVYLSRGLHVRTALLTATRGEGGQNLLGPEQAEAMGLLRTGEAVAAAGYYGVDQYFTRAYDFGFSKSAAETLAKWPREIVLADIVRVMRTVRPDIVVSRFEGSPRDGHGHHQAIGVLTREAFRLAGDPAAFPEQLEEGLHPWQPWRLYQDGGWLSGSPPSVGAVVNLGAYDPVIGLSYFELGTLGLSQHRSQDMAARVATKGSRRAVFTLVDGSPGETPQATSLLEGFDTTISGILARLPEGKTALPALAGLLAVADNHARAAAQHFDWRSLERSYPDVLGGLRSLRDAIRTVETSAAPDSLKADLLFLLRWKETDFINAAVRLAGAELDVAADDDAVVSGQTLRISVKTYNRGTAPFDAVRASLEAPPDWQVESMREAAESLGPGEETGAEFSVRIAENTAPSRPYYYRSSGVASHYSLQSPEDQTLPYAHPPLAARLDFAVGGESLAIQKPVTAPRVDLAQGTDEPNLRVVPALSVQIEPSFAIVSSAFGGMTREWRVAVTNNTPEPAEGTVELVAPPAWKVEPAHSAFRCSRESETAVARFRVTLPEALELQSRRIRAVARMHGTEFTTWEQVVSYPRIRTAALIHPTESHVEVLDLGVSQNLSIGYILGTQDLIPEALHRMGLPVRLLAPDDLAFGDFSGFDCIIAGVRAYSCREDLRQHNQRLLKYVRDGGVYIVQYNKSVDWDPDQFAPYPASYVGHDRITVEDAPVVILVPEHPIFNHPNPITERDFEGWVQERGLYFWSEWDPRYVPLLSGHDPGEPPRKGGMLVAEYGRGLYVYTAYAWFRQLPAAVPGAFRLFANLVSLPETRSLPPSAPREAEQ